MNKEFVPYEEALTLKELGFDEPCLAKHDLKNILLRVEECKSQENASEFDYILAPLYQQVFRWFREKYGLNSQIAFCEYAIESCNSWKYTFDNPSRQYWNGNFNTYEEAESACLDKLIEIVRNIKP